MDVEKPVYLDAISEEYLKRAGLSKNDAAWAFRLACQLSDAAQTRRAQLRAQISSERTPEQEIRERAEDDRVFLGAVVLLASRVK